MATLILGATGFVGRALVPALAEAGEIVRAASRRRVDSATRAAAGEEANRATFSSLPTVTRVRCDVRDSRALAAAFAGVESVYYLVHSMGSGGDFRRQERESARNVARAAAEAGASRLVYLGGVAPRVAPSEHLASRIEVGEILRAGAVPALELRASMIIGNGSVSWHIVRDLAMRLPLMLLPKWLESRSCPIAVADVVTALLAARRLPLVGGAWYDIPGPEVLSARAMLERVGALRGRSVPMLRVPVLSPRLSALWLKLVTGADYAIARELVLGLAGDLLPCDERYWELTGHRPQWSFDRAARHALDAEPQPEGLAKLEEDLVQRLTSRGRS
jgi:uncharacterized protein YbjT (DUF2867 family)